VVCFIASGIAAAAQSAPEYPPLNRFEWFADATLGPASLTGGIIVAGWGTLFDRPKEYDTHWDGFGHRYGLHVSQCATSNALEAETGALWGEDSRYFPATGEPLHKRVGHVVKYTFMAVDRDGRTRPAFARYAAISGSNFISNNWRPESEDNSTNTGERIALGFIGRMAGNAFQEFWPDLRQHVFRRHSGTGDAQ
jgi:hypothetical protein